MKLERLFLILVFLLTSSCATLRGNSQQVKVASDPPGADILYEGTVLGQTPSFVDIPRDEENSITLRFSDGNTVEQPLETTYRWGDSFFSNLIWAVVGAPVGWGIDFLSGSAWEYKKLPMLSDPGKMTASRPGSLDQGSRVIAIAPPQEDFELLSDELGIQLEKISKSHYPKDKTSAFEDTHPIFNSFSYNESNTVRNIYRDKLYFELKSSHVLETTAEREPKGVLLQSRLTDIYTDHEIDHFSELIPYSDLKTTQKGSLFETLSSLVSFIPNTVFFDFTQSQVSFTSDSSASAYVPISDKDQNAWTLLTSFAFRNSRSPKFDELKGVFRLIPDLNFYYDQFHFDRNAAINPLQGLTFSWVSLAFGFGAEGGLESPIGYFYLDLIPSLTFNWISSPTSGSSLGSLEFNAELGYSIFVSQRIVLRLFGRAITGPAEQWDALLSSAASGPVSIKSVFHGFYGLAVGYYFPEAKSIVKKTLF